MVTSRVTVPTRKTLVQPNPTSGVSKGKSHSLSILICWKAAQQRMSAKLPLSTNTDWVLKLAIDRQMTRASLWGWWSHRASSLVKLMVRLSTIVIFGIQLEIQMLYTIHKYVFLVFLKKPTIVLPPTIALISPSEALDRSSARQFGSRSLGGFFPPLTNLGNFPCLMRVFICYFKSQHSEVLFLQS